MSTLVTGPTRRHYCWPCAPPRCRPCSSRRRPTGIAHHAAALQALCVAPLTLRVTLSPHGPCSLCRHPVGLARHAATPLALCVVPALRPAGPPSASHLTPARRERKSEYRRRNWRRERIGLREKKLEKRK
jgi:hypothetical protein